MENQLWGPIQAKEWKKVPCMRGRVASEEDVKAGRAVFYLDELNQPPSPTELHPMRLPAAALLSERHGAETACKPVVVIQLESATEGIIAGFRPLSGGNGICLYEELQFIDNFDKWSE